MLFPAFQVRLQWLQGGSRVETSSALCITRRTFSPVGQAHGLATNSPKFGCWMLRRVSPWGWSPVFPVENNPVLIAPPGDSTVDRGTAERPIAAGNWGFDGANQATPAAETRFRAGTDQGPGWASRRCQRGDVQLGQPITDATSFQNLGL